MRIHERDLVAVATAAIAWNRARLVRIATAKRVLPWLHPQHKLTDDALRYSRKAEAKALAALRKVCASVDPAAITIDAELQSEGNLEGLPYDV